LFASSSLSGPDSSILVVGAGPAGATAARALAVAGVRVRLLDRAAGFPRNKPCGGGISTRVLKRFPYLGRSLGRITTHYISRLYLEGPDGQSTVVHTDVPAALMIRRVEFDALLVSLAVEAGAELIAGADVSQVSTGADEVTLVTRDGRRFTAPIVIAADGVHSSVGRRTGLNPGWPASAVALDMMEETPRAQLRDVDPSTLWVAYGERGYAYIFPKRDHVNIGIGCVLSHFRSDVNRSPYALQREFVDGLRHRGLVEGDSVRANFTPFLIPVGGPLAHPGAGRVLLAGDAGGFVNGFTAEGIYYAMVSGELAARAVLRGPVAGLAARYGRAVRYEIGAELRDSILIQRHLFADRRRIADVVTGAHREGTIVRLAVDLAVGRRSYRQVRRRMFVHAPALAVRFLRERLRKTD
jgi:geranylgeranyl reductase family protein